MIVVVVVVVEVEVVVYSLSNLYVQIIYNFIPETKHIYRVYIYIQGC